MSVPTEKITEERLAIWKQLLEKQHATPMVLIGVGHDHKEGELVVCTLNDVDDSTLLALLCFAVEKLSPGTIRKQKP